MEKSLGGFHSHIRGVLACLHDESYKSLNLTLYYLSIWLLVFIYCLSFFLALSQYYLKEYQYLHGPTGIEPPVTLSVETEFECCTRVSRIA